MHCVYVHRNKEGSPVDDGMKRPCAVVFDVGTVLVDWNPAYLYDRLIADPEERAWFLTHVVTLSWHSEQDRGRSCAEGVSALCERFPGYEPLIGAFYERWLETIAGPIEGSVALMRELKAAGVPVYGLTNFSAELWPQSVAAYPFLGEFDAVAVSGEIGDIKPARRIFDVLVERSGRPPAELVYNDDREDNLATAHALGMRCLLFETPEKLRHDLAELGFPVAAGDAAAPAAGTASKGVSSSRVFAAPAASVSGL